jgi:centriolar protein POC1
LQCHLLLCVPAADTREGRSTVLKAHTGTVRCVEFSNDGSMLITGSDDKTAKVSSRLQGLADYCAKRHTCDSFLPDPG